MIETATLLVIEGRSADSPVFSTDLLKKGFDVKQVASGGQALALLQQGVAPDAIILNAASLRTSGKRICRSVREVCRTSPILLILDENTLQEKVDADVVLSLPFTAQKLVNRIRHLLPGEGKNIQNRGPIRLDVEHRTVRCLGKQSRLTPRLMQLLSVLMQKHGEVIERKALFSKVWETDYTDDTRTLDVHISWLRKAIEVDPDHPRFLKTIRGVGYRLDV